MKLIEGQSVYVLTERYKDGDDEILGVFENKDAMLKSFTDMMSDIMKHDKVKDIPYEVNRLSYRLMSDDADFGDECGYGRSVYGCQCWPIQSLVDDDVPDNNKEENEDGD